MAKLSKAKIEEHMKLFREQSFQPHTINRELGISAPFASIQLRELVAEGKIVHLGRGRYKWKV